MSSPQLIQLRMDVEGGRFDDHSWTIRLNGAPTDANLARYCRRMNASFAPGGVNACRAEGPEPMRITKATLVNVITGDVEASWTCPD